MKFTISLLLGLVVSMSAFADFFSLSPAMNTVSPAQKNSLCVEIQRNLAVARTLPTDFVKRCKSGAHFSLQQDFIPEEPRSVRVYNVIVPSRLLGQPSDSDSANYFFGMYENREGRMTWNFGLNL